MCVFNLLLLLVSCPSSSPILFTRPVKFPWILSTHEVIYQGCVFVFVFVLLMMEESVCSGLVCLSSSWWSFVILGSFLSSSHYFLLLLFSFWPFLGAHISPFLGFLPCCVGAHPSVTCWEGSGSDLKPAVCIRSLNCPIFIKTGHSVL